jgi:death-on-curing protein
MKYLAVRHILRIHERVIETSGGDPTILDLGKIDSAVAQPRMTFEGGSLYPTLAEKAAALAFSLNKNHPFQDGNKRTSHAAMEMFLLRNGHEIDATVDEQEAVFLGVAAGHISRDVFTNWVKSHIVRRGWRRPVQAGAGTSETGDEPARIVLEHAGGPLDGFAASSDSSNPEEAEWVRGMYYWMHPGGEIGRAYMGNWIELYRILRERARKSGYAGGLQAHVYRIVARRVEGNTVFVRYEHEGPASNDTGET